MSRLSSYGCARASRASDSVCPASFHPVAATSTIDRATATSRLYNPGTGCSIFAGLRFKL